VSYAQRKVGHALKGYEKRDDRRKVESMQPIKEAVAEEREAKEFTILQLIPAVLAT
jgi:hypothetical protein